MFEAGFNTVLARWLATNLPVVRSNTRRVVCAPANLECAIQPLIVWLIVAAPALGTTTARDTTTEAATARSMFVRLRDAQVVAGKNRRLGPA